MNTYGYVGGNPLYWTDPYGLEPNALDSLRASGNEAADILNDIARNKHSRTLDEYRKRYPGAFGPASQAPQTDIRFKYDDEAWGDFSKTIAGACGALATRKPNKLNDLLDLTGHRKDHILNRHRAGAGKPGKTEFPGSWSDEDILRRISDIATDPNATRGVGKWNSPYAVGTRDGIEIRVDFYPDSHSKHSGQISTGYPINVPANP